MNNVTSVPAQSMDAFSFFSNVITVISDITNGIATAVGITSPYQTYAIAGLLLLMSALVLFRFMELSTKLLIFVILAWVVASIFGFV